MVDPGRERREVTRDATVSSRAPPGIDTCARAMGNVCVCVCVCAIMPACRRRSRRVAPLALVSRERVEQKDVDRMLMSGKGREISRIGKCLVGIISRLIFLPVLSLSIRKKFPYSPFGRAFT